MNSEQTLSKKRTPRYSLVRLGRAPFLIAGIASLALGVWGGLIRLPLNIPLPSTAANWITFHGPLMVCAFLGTVISLERAVGLQKWWTYIPPLCVGAGGLWIASGGLGSAGPLLIAVGSLLFVGVSIRVVFLSRTLFSVVMATGALSWLVGNALWLQGWSVNRVVPWWIGFLGLTIVGERLDLTRFQKMPAWATRLLACFVALFLAGCIATVFAQRPGEWVVGSAMILMAAWLSRFDLARRALKQTDLPRFMAWCLLPGYAWMAISGALLAWNSPLESGPLYDAALHSFFVGFVFAMIFGHAPVIFPSILHFPMSYHWRFYAHLILLHAGLVMRVTGDLAGMPSLRVWGGTINAIAIGLFLLNTVTAVIASVVSARVAQRKRKKGVKG